MRSSRGFSVLAVFCMWLGVAGRASGQSAAWRDLSAAGKKAFQQGRYVDAERAFNAALGQAQDFGPQDPRLPASLNNLAALYYFRGNLAQAELLYQQALNIETKVLGPKPPGEEAYLNMMANVRRLQGNYAQAELLYGRALQLEEKALGPGHPRVAATLEHLAETYSEEGNYAGAAALSGRAAAIWQTTLGPGHPYVARSLDEYSRAAREIQKNWKVAPAQPAAGEAKSPRPPESRRIEVR